MDNICLIWQLYFQNISNYSNLTDLDTFGCYRWNLYEIIQGELGGTDQALELNCIQENNVIWFQSTAIYYYYNLNCK